MDSRKIQRKGTYCTYAKHIRKWLDFEWQRFGKAPLGGNVGPFVGITLMPLCSPKGELFLYDLFLLRIRVQAHVNHLCDCDFAPVPYEEHRGCDGAVFVCRYACSLFAMRHRKFTWDNVGDRCLTLITREPAFQFDLTDIARIREELGILIDRLGSISI